MTTLSVSGAGRFSAARRRSSDAVHDLTLAVSLVVTLLLPGALGLAHLLKG